MRSAFATLVVTMAFAGAAAPCLARDDAVPAPRSARTVFAPVQPEGLVGPEGTGMVAEVHSLREAIRQTYWGNPNLLSQRASVRSADNRYPAARATYGLTLNTQVTHSYQRDRQETALFGYLGDQGWSTVATAILTQPLFTFGRNTGAANVALAEVAFARDSLRLAETQTLLSAITSYIAVIRDRESVGIARENLALLDRQLSDSRERYQVRDITESDLQQIETRVELGRAQLLLAAGQVATSEAQFVQIIGARPGRLAPPVELTVPLTSLDQAYDMGNDRSPVIRAAQSREKISRASVKALKAEFGPRIDARGIATYGTVSPYANDLRATQLRGEVVLAMPLLDANLRRSRVREAEEANAADWRLIDQAGRDIHASIASSWQQLVTSRASLGNYQRAVDAARKAYDGAVVQETAGDRTTLDVLDLARDLLNVRNGYVSARANEYASRANLLAAMGTLEAPDLVPDLERYDPTDHFDKVQRTGDVPLMTDALFGLDRVTAGSVATDRAIRDPGAGVRLDSATPLGPTPAP